MALKFLIIGRGYIGTYLSNRLPNASLYDGYVTSGNELKKILLEKYPGHILINCAGKTGRPNIDWCEDHKGETFCCNVSIPTIIAEVCKEIKQYWIHIGSGCIYDGYDKHWTEEDEPNFYGSFYSKTKIWSQQILEGYDEVCILRIRMPIDEELKERSYIAKIVRYAKEGKLLFNAHNSMTVLSDLAEAIKFLAEKGHIGTWNIVNDGYMTIEEILRIYRKCVDSALQYKIGSIYEVQRKLKAKRSNCILSIDKLKNEGFMIPHIEPQIEKILSIYGAERNPL